MHKWMQRYLMYHMCVCGSNLLYSCQLLTWGLPRDDAYTIPLLCSRWVARCVGSPASPASSSPSPRITRAPGSTAATARSRSRAPAPRGARGELRRGGERRLRGAVRPRHRAQRRPLAAAAGGGAALRAAANRRRRRGGARPRAAARRRAAPAATSRARRRRRAAAGARAVPPPLRNQLRGAELGRVRGRGRGAALEYVMEVAFALSKAFGRACAVPLHLLVQTYAPIYIYKYRCVHIHDTYVHKRTFTYRRRGAGRPGPHAVDRA